MELDPLEVIAVAFGLVSVWLSVREHIWSWPTAIVNVAIYFFIFQRERLYADMGLQVFYAGISVYGWYHWLHGGQNRTELPVSRTPRSLWPILGALWVGGTLGLGTLLGHYTDASAPYFDSALSVGSLLAQWMMSRKYLENWAIWIGLDVAYVGLFISRGLLPTAFQYGVFLLLATRGLVAWRASLARREGVASP